MLDAEGRRDDVAAPFCVRGSWVRWLVGSWVLVRECTCW